MFAIVYNLRLTGPEIRAFRAFDLVSRLPLSQSLGRNGGSLRQFPKSFRFAETFGGDWFDQDCRPRAAVSLGSDGGRPAGRLLVVEQVCLTRQLGVVSARVLEGFLNLRQDIA